MECLLCFPKVWSGFWGFGWSKNAGLFLMFGLSVMVMQHGLQLSCLIRFALGLIGKVCELVCSKLDFCDFWDEKLGPCRKCVQGLCKMAVLQLHAIQRPDGFNADSSEVFNDCVAHDHSYQSCDLEGYYQGCLNECSCQYDFDLFWDCDDNFYGNIDDENGFFDVVALREMIKTERQRADTALVELEKERLAVASAAEEAMAMILRLQNEKSFIEIEARNFKKMAEQKMLYDQETIQSLRLLLFKHESEQRLLEKRLMLCRQKLKLYSHEIDDVSQFEGLNTSFSDFAFSL